MADLNFHNVHSLCARVNLSAERPVIDLSKITWFEPYALIYLGMFLRYYNRQGIYFDVVYPERAAARDYLTQQNFWSRFNFVPDSRTDRSLLRFFSSTSFNDIIDIENRRDQADEIAYALQDMLQRRSVQVHAENIAMAVAELVDNFAQHALTGLGAIMVQCYPTKQVVRVGIGDCGVGIKQSLLNCGRYPQLSLVSNKEAIAKAFEPKVTCKHEGGMGFGFVTDIVIEEHAQMFLSSGDGCIFIDKGGNMYSMDVPYSLPGVQVELCFLER